ncbi:MAG: hypothetical protein EPN84_00190 [Legionella sp.]|nr:MAG: hypothetical protein EPN84_00190 [Legionella sp.]
MFAMLKDKIKFVFIGALLFSSTPLFAAQDIQAITPKEQYLKTIDFIDKMAKDIYCYWDLKKEQHNVDWPTLINQAKARINEQTSLEQFQEILIQLAASIHDGHVNYRYPYKTKIFYTPILVKKLDDGYYISQVEQDKMTPYPVDLQSGDKVLGVNDQSIEEYISSKEQYISASTNSARQSYASAALNSLEKFKTAPEGTLTVTVSKYDTHQIKTVDLPWIVFERKLPDIRPLSEVVKSKILPGNIGVLNVTQMSHEEGVDALIAAVKREMQALKNTNALIIDVRYNGGGAGEIGDSIISHFITQKVRRYQAQLKNSTQALYGRPNLVELFNQTDPAQYVYSEWLDYNIEPMKNDKPVYAKPVYILTNEFCFSACDTFVDSFSSNHIGEILGAQTGGGTGYPLWFDLPWNLGSFRFSILRGYSNHERYLEGTGTIPDVKITTTPRDLHHQLDGELIAAYDYVLKKLKGNQKNFSALKGKALTHYFSATQPEIVPFYIQEEYWQKLQ